MTDSSFVLKVGKLTSTCPHGMQTKVGSRFLWHATPSRQPGRGFPHRVRSHCKEVVSDTLRRHSASRSLSGDFGDGSAGAGLSVLLIDASQPL